MERQSLPRLIAAALLWAGASVLAAAEPPSAAEIEFWRSTERLATPEAYRAYLAAFPNGLYVPLARSALGAGAAAPAAAEPAAAPRSPMALRYFSEEPDTGTIAFNIGDRFSGPGALTFGRLGARRQIVLPAGDWVVLAGTDWRTTLANNQSISGSDASMSTVVFGKFAGDRLSTMLRFSANTRPPPGTAGGVVGLNWPDTDRCDERTNTRLFHERTRPTAFRDECTSIWVAADPFAEPWPANDEAKNNIARLGASAGGAAIVTTLTFGERRYGYLGIVRVDWPNSGPGSEQVGAWQPDQIAQVPARRAFIKMLTDWAATYRKAALEGYHSDYPGDDLRPVAAFR